MALIAGIDIGTNTFRLLVAEMDDAQSIREICSAKEITRLGEGFSTKKAFLPAAVERAIAALKRFKEILQKYPVEDLIVVGTSAVHGGNPALPILIASGYGGSGFETRALSAGVNRVLKKPYRMNEIAEVLASFFAARPQI